MSSQNISIFHFSQSSQDTIYQRHLVSYKHNLMPADGSDRDSRKSGLVSSLPVDGSDRDSRKSGLVSIMKAVSLSPRQLVRVWSCKGRTLVFTGADVLFYCHSYMFLELFGILTCSDHPF
jgi:hypothetical protein